MSVPADYGSCLPLTAAQSGVWVAHHLNRDAATYNLAKYVEILGPVDPAAFERALVRAGRECGAFDVRLRPAEDGRSAVQELTPTAQTPTFTDLSQGSDPAGEAVAWMERDWRAPVDLTADGLFKDVLFRVGPQRYFWYSRCHHILVDGYGDELLTRRVAELYGRETARTTGGDAGGGTGSDASDDTAGDTAVGFRGGDVRSLVADEAAYRASPRYGEDRAYWTERFADRPPVARLAGRAATQVPSDFLRRRSHLTATEFDRLRAAAREVRVTWTVLFAAAVALYLRSATGLTDVTIGIPVTGRRPATRHTPGMLANELPLRVSAHPALTKREMLRGTSAALADLLDRQHYPYEDLRRELPDSADAGHLFGPTLNMMSFEDDLTFGALPTRQHRLANGPVKDVSITVSVGSDSSPVIDFDANPTVYDDAALELHRTRFLRLLDALAAAAPDLPVGRLDVVDAAERDALAARGCGAPGPAEPATVTGLFAARAARTPDADAVVSVEETLGYALLAGRADALAGALGGATRVAVLLERSATTVVAHLAVLRAGGCVVPLDPRAPDERLAAVLREAAVEVLLTDRADPVSGAPAGLRTIDPRTIDAAGAPAPARPADPRSAAYVIFTSGSTGVPKGAVLTHGAIADLVRDSRLSGPAHARLPLHSSPAFDASLLEMWTPLLNGGTVVVPPPGDLDPQVVRSLVAEGGISAIWLTAGVFRLLAQEDPGCLAGLREVWTGGDVVPAAEVARVLEACPGLTVVDGYGPTETTVFATRHAVRSGPPADGAVPIGLPMDGMQVRVLDCALRPAPAGVTGELYIAGSGLARGYLGQSARTAERFVADPWSPDGGRMYRTGDLVRWTEDGELAFVGRADGQVKIRGFRVEPGEIELAVLTHPGVAQAVVAARQAPTGSKQLIAWVVPADGAAVDPEALRTHAAGLLPDYMVPSVVVPLPALPVTANGKVDRRALPQPEFGASAGGRAPADDRERLVCALFADVLNLPEVCADDSFFALGGDSIVAIQLAARGRKQGLALTPHDVFAHKTPAALAAAVPDLGEAQEFPAAADDPSLLLDQDELDELEAQWELSQ